MENNENQIHSEYDGIVEHNNPMPGWWTWTFIITVIFAAIYYFHYEVTKEGLTLNQELKISMEKIDKIRAENALKVQTLSDDEILQLMKDPKKIELGAATYTAKCGMCHGDKLEGKIGPNLTDATWIHGTGKPTEVVKTIREGVSAKGMPMWEGVLKGDEIYAVTAFILSKK